MGTLDYIVLFVFFAAMVLIGFIASKKVSNSKDFFVAGGKVPWWLAGVSHHVSGYSGVVFVGYALIAYKYGITIYFWWAIPITIACMVGAFTIAPKWVLIRKKYNIQSPTEYLANRYNLPTQQVIAWSGVILKLFDVSAKWLAMGILLNGFTNLPIYIGIIISACVSLIYVTIGGLWADLWNDFIQFGVMLFAGIVVFIATLNYLGGFSAIFTVWHRLPPGHSHPFNGPYTVLFMISFIFISFLSYNGGTWNLATRFIANPSGKSARKTALLSGILYLIWPLFLFFPMCVSPLIFPHLSDPSKVYALLVLKFLPPGFVGLVLASLFANTMSMTTSDANTISAVITRDIMPVFLKKIKSYTGEKSLKIARISTFTFTLITIIMALNASYFGGVLGLIITWFAALVGTTAVPMLLGLLPIFRKAGSIIALLSIFAGIFIFILDKQFPVSAGFQVGAPVITSLIVFVGATFIKTALDFIKIKYSK
ncbi:MAG: Na+:solute symporter [bacterium]|nr:Na+:solute symporter [bacterium]